MGTATYSEMQDRVIQLLTLSGWSNGFPLPNPAVLVNYGVGEFVRYTNANQELCIIETVANQAEYKLTSDLPDFPQGFPLGPRLWFAINDDALWNVLPATSTSPGTPGNGSPLVQTTREKLRMSNWQYLDTAPSTPSWWYMAQDQVIGLYPPPSVSGNLIQFSGNRELPPMQKGDDTLPWHDRYAEAVCLFGAVQYGKTQARGEELTTLARYKAEAMQLTVEYNNDWSDKQAALVNRFVKAPLNEYMSAGCRAWWRWNPPSTGPFPGQDSLL